MARKEKEEKGLTGSKEIFSSNTNFLIVDHLSSTKSREVAAISVTNVDLIEEFVFSAAFSTFDQVTFVKMLCVLYFFLVRELEGCGRLT